MATLQTFRDYASSSFVGKLNITALIYFSVHWFGEIHPECWHLYIVTPPERSTASRIFLCVPKKQLSWWFANHRWGLRQGSWNDFTYLFGANSWLVWDMALYMLIMLYCIYYHTRWVHMIPFSSRNCPFSSSLDLALIESMTFPTFSKGRMFCLFCWVTRKYCSSDALHPSHYCTFIRSISFNLICNLCNLDFSTLAQKKIIVFFRWVLGVI